MDYDVKQIRKFLISFSLLSLTIGLLFGFLLSHIYLTPPFREIYVPFTPIKPSSELSYTASVTLEKLMISPTVDGKVMWNETYITNYVKIFSNNSFVMFTPSVNITFKNDSYYFSGGYFVIQYHWFWIVSATLNDFSVYINESRTKTNNTSFFIEGGDIVIKFDLVV